MYMYVCENVYMSAMPMVARRGQQTPLELELQVIKSHWNGHWDLDSVWSYAKAAALLPQSHLSDPELTFLLLSFVYDLKQVPRVSQVSCL